VALNLRVGRALIFLSRRHEFSLTSRSCSSSRMPPFLYALDSSLFLIFICSLKDSRMVSFSLSLTPASDVFSPLIIHFPRLGDPILPLCMSPRGFFLPPHSPSPAHREPFALHNAMIGRLIHGWVDFSSCSRPPILRFPLAKRSDFG